MILGKALAKRMCDLTLLQVIDDPGEFHWTHMSA